jgi:curved DNA-binding protein CbpA
VGESMNHYLVLGIEKDASQKEIERAFTRVDTQNYTLLGGIGMGGKQTALIEETYAVLSDPQRRAEYDKKRAHEEA